MLRERAADSFAGVEHILSFGIAGGAAAVITEADTLQELGELPGLGLGQHDVDLDEGTMSVSKFVGRCTILGLVAYLFVKGALVLRPRETTAALSARSATT